MKGHVFRGLFGGFLFGIFLSLTLFIYGVLNFGDDLMWILPLVFLLLGLVLAAWAPFGSSDAGEPAAAEPPVEADNSAETDEADDAAEQPGEPTS